MGAGETVGPAATSIGGEPLGTSRTGANSEGSPTDASGRDPPGIAEPLSVDDTIPESPTMSGGGAAGVAGSTVNVGPEGSCSVATTIGDASAATTTSIQSDKVQPHAADNGSSGHQTRGPHGGPLSRSPREAIHGQLSSAAPPNSDDWPVSSREAAMLRPNPRLGIQERHGPGVRQPCSGKSACGFSPPSQSSQVLCRRSRGAMIRRRSSSSNSSVEARERASAEPVGGAL